MSRWKALPAELDPRVRQLLVRLRRLKDHNGLTLRQLAARTGYSAKSWERYLNGRSVPPRDAVEALARTTGEDTTRLLALHEVAVAARREGRTGANEGKETPAEPETEMPEREFTPGRDAEEFRVSRRTLTIVLVSGCAALLLSVASAVLVTVRLMDDGKDAAPAPAAHVASTDGAPPAPTKAAYRCRLERTGGRWYAGNSQAMDATVAYGDTGPQVAEVQCLLRRAGISPGGIDGSFGPLTLGAVERFQIQARLDVDGVAGPHTWKALRG